MDSKNITNKVSVTRLKCEYMTEPIGIDIKLPRLSWEIASSGRGIMQTAYRIIVALASNKISLHY